MAWGTELWVCRKCLLFRLTSGLICAHFERNFTSYLPVFRIVLTLSRITHNNRLNLSKKFQNLPRRDLELNKTMRRN